MTAIDLFCGCGGLTKGFIDAGINVICGIDVWDTAIESYSFNFNHLALCKDLKQYPPNELSELLDNVSIDIIAGGPPCQGFSIAGKRDKNDPPRHRED